MLFSGMKEDGLLTVHDILQGWLGEFSLSAAGIERNHPGRPSLVLHPGEIHQKGAAAYQKRLPPEKTRRLLSRLIRDQEVPVTFTQPLDITPYHSS